MSDLSNSEIRALAKAIGLDIQEEHLSEVGFFVNALVEAMGAVDEPGRERIEPLPILLPREGGQA